mgnify:CR=1 FL=1
MGSAQARLTLASTSPQRRVILEQLGLPFGVVIGRTVWRSVADGLGVVSAPVVPVALLAAVVPAVRAASSAALRRTTGDACRLPPLFRRTHHIPWREAKCHRVAQYTWG